MTLTSLVVVSLFGCAIVDKFNDTKQKIQDVQDAVDGLTNPLVTQGVVLGAEEPDDPAIRDFVENTDFGPGTAVTLFLADAADADQVEQAPVTGADVTVDGSDIVTAKEDGGGVYTVKPGKLEYLDEDTWTVQVDVKGEKKSSFIDVFLPLAPSFDMPASWDKGQDMVLDFSDMGFDSALVVVIDSGGEVTWTNKPETATDLLGVTQSDGAVEVLVPGDQAFPKKDLYAVGVAGMIHSENDAAENMNTVLSSLMAGKTRFYAVSTVPLP